MSDYNDDIGFEIGMSPKAAVRLGDEVSTRPLFTPSVESFALVMCYPLRRASWYSRLQLQHRRMVMLGVEL